jgi:hypothetical protein
MQHFTDPGRNQIGGQVPLARFAQSAAFAGDAEERRKVSFESVDGRAIMEGVSGDGKLTELFDYFVSENDRRR